MIIAKNYWFELLRIFLVLRKLSLMLPLGLVVWIRIKLKQRLASYFVHNDNQR
jgi:hypothetical protein